MVNTKIKWILCTAFLAGFVFLFTGASFANLMLMHPSVKLFLKQGEKHSGGIILQNTANGPLKIKAEFADDLDINKKSIKRACAKWIKLDETEFTIPANGFKDLRYTVDVPKDAKGGYWTGLVYSYDGGQMPAPGGMAMNIKMHIEAPINIGVIDTIENDLSVISVEPSYGDGSIKISALVRNIGNIFEEVTSYFLVYDQAGKISATLNYPAVKIYPEKEKYVTAAKETTLSAGRYKVVCLFDYGFNKLKTTEELLEVK